MASYTFQKVVTDLVQLDTYINSLGLSDYLYSVQDHQGLTLTFANETDADALTAAVDSFQEKKTGSNHCENILTTPVTISNKDWTVACAWVYPGSNIFDLRYLMMILDVTPIEKNDVFYLRVYDVTNKRVVAFTQGSSGGDVQIMLDTLPTTECTLELQGKVTQTGDVLQIKHVCSG